MLNCPIHSVAPLLPHSGAMVLLDQIAAYDHTHLVAYADINERHIFVVDGQLPLIGAIEIMAQGVAALAGCWAHDRGEPVQLGFLLGSRKYELFAASVPVGSRLKISVTASLQDSNGFGVFDAALFWVSGPLDLPAQHLLAQAKLNVFSPPDVAAYLQQEASA